jgi:formyltetrahydrofolate-dependent phosphoribosylglycinamide formyltransferase
MPTLLPKLIVLISGHGSNLQALIDATHQNILSAQIVRVISNRRDAYGLTRAEQAGIPTLYFPLKPYTDRGRTRIAYDQDLAAQIAPLKPDLIVLAGFMHILSPEFLAHFPKRVINLHPALPGTFIGANGIEQTFQAWQAGQIGAGGCMVHYVIPQVDAGEVIDYRTVPFLPEDTLEKFAERLHEAEHDLIVSATRKALEK